MSFNRLQNEMRLQAERVLGQKSHGRWGLVDAYDPNSYAVKIQFQPEDRITGWLPIKTQFVGNGFGLQFGPAVGDMAFVVFEDGDGEAGSVVGFGFNDSDRPQAVPSGEAWLTHSSGTFIKLHNDGSLEIHTKADLNATVGGKLNATVTGDADLTVSGSATAKVSGSADLEISGSATAKAASWAVTGDMTLQGNLTQTGNFMQTGNLTTSGTVAATGSISSGASVSDSSGSMASMRSTFDSHTHTDPQGGVTSGPSSSM